MIIAGRLAQVCPFVLAGCLIGGCTTDADDTPDNPSDTGFTTDADDTPDNPSDTGFTNGSDEASDNPSGDVPQATVEDRGVVECWGRERYGLNRPPDGVSFKEIAAGSSHTCGIRSDNTVACWGSDQFGESTPPSGTFKTLAAGFYHACGIRASDGSVECWGTRGGYATTDGGVPSWPTASVSFQAIALGGDFDCGILSNGNLRCWPLSVAPVPPTGPFRAVTVGWWHGCAIRHDDTVACWGTGEGVSSTPPSGTFTAIAAGQSHTCGIRGDRKVSGRWTWTSAELEIDGTRLASDAAAGHEGVWSVTRRASN